MPCSGSPPPAVSSAAATEGSGSSLKTASVDGDAGGPVAACPVGSAPREDAGDDESSSPSAPVASESLFSWPATVPKSATVARLVYDLSVLTPLLRSLPSIVDALELSFWGLYRYQD